MSLSGQMVLTSATEFHSPQSHIATFSDTNLSDRSNDFVATIDWGNGETDTGQPVFGNAGSFTVDGFPPYTDEGSFTATVTLTHTTDQAQSTVSGNVAVGEGDVLSALGHFSFTATANQILSRQPGNGSIAQFGDSVLNPPGDFTASIDWGDGQTTPGAVVSSSALLNGR